MTTTRQETVKTCQAIDSHDANFGYGPSDSYEVACTEPATTTVTVEFYGENGVEQDTSVACSMHAETAQTVPGALYVISKVALT